MSLDIWLSIEVDTGGSTPYAVGLYSANYTHNVTNMWRKAGVYEALYKSSGKTAGEIIPVLEEGLYAMTVDLESYEALNPPNGWGDAASALEFLDELLRACTIHPKAIISISA